MIGKWDAVMFVAVLIFGLLNMGEPNILQAIATNIATCK